MPNHNVPKEVTSLFVECMLQLKRDEIWESIGSTLLAKVVDLLTNLDVNISWETILQEEHNKGIFDMDLEDADENADNFGLKDSEDTGVFKDNAFADKLDGLTNLRLLMAIWEKYLKHLRNPSENSDECS